VTSGTPPRIVSVTGTNGKTTVCRMIAHALRATGRRVALTSTSGIWVDGRLVAEGDCTGPWSARNALEHDGLDVAVLETARGGIVRRGIGYRDADVAVITNISADHLGQDGLTTVADLVAVKGRVAASIRAGGTLVLNGADPSTDAVLRRADVRALSPEVVLFARGRAVTRVRRHLRRGGRAVVLDDLGAHAVEVSPGGELPLLDPAAVPVTLAATCTFNVENVLAAAAALRGLDAADAVHALTGFGPEANPGRLERHRIADRDVIIDYGHNPAALAALADATARLGHGFRTCVLGLPGDRTDELLAAGARAVAGFDLVVVREDRDRRGRAPGEVPALLATTLRRAGVRALRVVPDELDAVADAVASTPPGGLVLAIAERPADLVAARGELARRVHERDRLEGGPRACPTRRAG
jgi:cyanophycin synthetase